MGYINTEELRKYRELVVITERMVEIAESFSSSKRRDQLELIMQGMVKKLVGSSKRVVDKAAEGHDYFSRWGGSGYGLTSDGLAEPFGRRTKKGNVKLRKTDFISYEYENSQYHYKVDAKVLKFLKECEESALVKDKERLAELILFIEKVNALDISDLEITKEYPVTISLVRQPESDDTGDAESYVYEVKSIGLKGKSGFHYHAEAISLGGSVVFKTPTWSQYQIISLPRTYAILKETLLDFEKIMIRERDEHFKKLNALIEEKGEYIVMNEL